MRRKSASHRDLLIKLLFFLLSPLFSATLTAGTRQDITKPACARITFEDSLHLTVKVGPKTLIDERLRVNEMGTVYLPDVGRHQVLGLTPAEASRKIASLYDTPKRYPHAITALSYAPVFRNTALDH